MKNRMVWVLGLVVLFVFASDAKADPLTFQFTGTVSSVGAGLSGGPFSIGQAVSGTYTVDSATVDLFPGLPFLGDYRPASNSVSWGAGAYNLSSTAGTVFVFNNSGGSDRYGNEATVPLGSTLVGANVNGLAPTNFRFQLFDPTQTAFASIALPQTAPPLSAFTSNPNVTFIALTFGNAPGIRNQVRARVDSLRLVPVPEPLSLMLLASGLGVLAVRRRRRAES